MRRFNVASAVVVLSSILTGNVFGGARYNVTDLGALGGIYTNSYAYGINDSGQVVGYSNSADCAEWQHAFLYSGSTMTDLGTLGGPYTESSARGINNSGQIVGWSWGAGVNAHAFLYSGSTMTDLGTHGYAYSTAFAINNSGQIVGRHNNSYPNFAMRGFVYIPGFSTTTELGTLGGIYTNSAAYGINDSGQIVGSSFDNSFLGHAVLYSGSTMTDLGTLGGTSSEAFAINNSGQVVGSSYTADNVSQHAFLYSGSTMTDLGTLGGTFSQASAINNNGQVVGSSTCNGSSHAFLYSNAAMTDLNTLIDPDSGWRLVSATAINNFGWIAGYGINPAGQAHAFLLVPKPTAAVTHVTATNPDGFYGLGSVIGIQVVFDGDVDVTGTPQLTLATNPTAVASYGSGSGSNTLLFNYTVRAGDAAADLDYLSTSALSANGGTITDAFNRSAILALPAPGAAGSLSYNKDIAVNTTPPRVANITATNESGTYGVGSVIGVQVVLDHPVTVTGTPRLTIGATPLRQVDYTSGSGTNTLLFNYTVQPGDTAADLDYASSTALILAGGTVRDAFGTNAILLLPPPGFVGSLSYNKDIAIDGVAPVVFDVTAVESDGVYGLGSTIRVQVIFSKPVIVTGTPQLMLNAGAGRTANYTSGSGSPTLQFDYTVQAGDSAERLDYTAASALVLNGGTIRDAASNNASVTLPAPGTPGSLGDNRNIAIDAAAPEAVEWYSARDHGADTVMIPLSLDGPTVEPRLGGLQRIYVGFTHGIELINPTGLVVIGYSTVGGLLQGAVDYSGSATLSVPDPYFLQIDFPAPPSSAALPDQTCYTIAMAGAVRGANGVALTGVATLHVRVLCGDATGNGQVNLGDALMIRNSINTRTVWDAPGLDLNCDGVIDNADMLFSKQKVAGSPAAAQCP